GKRKKRCTGKKKRGRESIPLTPKEAIETMEVRKEAEFKDKKILFVAFKEAGVNKYKTEAFEKHTETGFWIPTYLRSYTVAKDNKQLAEQMKMWEDDGQLR